MVKARLLYRKVDTLRPGLGMTLHRRSTPPKKDTACQSLNSKAGNTFAATGTVTILVEAVADYLKVTAHQHCRIKK